MGEVTILVTILGMSAVTLLIKMSPLVLLGNRKLPRGVEDIMKHLPVAVLSAMVVQLLMVKDGALNLTFDDALVWAALPTVVTAVVTRNLFASIAVGMGFVAVVRLIAG
ncbi:MAG: AzlD domain-containing protein [Proteobacteria bacterium]|nr:AzlD domain-containing protein [Pseudomonadota bacterium]MDA1059906.1 AzlD domain-containing protein [Pseudomonadota bacterium]